MVRPSDYSMRGQTGSHWIVSGGGGRRRFPSQAASWDALRSAEMVSPGGSAQSSWVLTSPSASMQSLMSPSHNLAFKRRPASSSIYAPPPLPPASPARPPASLTFEHTVDEVPRKWRPATPSPMQNVRSPSQRSLSTHFGTSASDPAGASWSSRPGSPKLSRPSSSSSLSFSPSLERWPRPARWPTESIALDVPVYGHPASIKQKPLRKAPYNDPFRKSGYCETTPSTETNIHSRLF